MAVSVTPIRPEWTMWPWLGRQDSSLRMTESKSACLFNYFKACFEKMIKTPSANLIAWQAFPNENRPVQDSLKRLIAADQVSLSP